MNNMDLLSGHAYDWSDPSIIKIIAGVTEAPAIAASKTPALGCRAARLADRALQALRQPWLQMCRRSRPRTEVLSVGELSRRATADGLRATGQSGGHSHAHRQLPRGAHDARGDLRDQPRAVTAPRGALRAGGERIVAAARPTDRRFRRCATPRQHGRGMACRRAARTHHRGDHR
jgi:hypothetical protein